VIGNGNVTKYLWAEWKPMFFDISFSSAPYLDDSNSQVCTTTKQTSISYNASAKYADGADADRAIGRQFAIQSGFHPRKGLEERVKIALQIRAFPPQAGIERNGTPESQVFGAMRQKMRPISFKLRIAGVHMLDICEDICKI
jgi:hypothetical protein